MDTASIVLRFSDWLRFEPTRPHKRLGGKTFTWEELHHIDRDTINRPLGRLWRIL